MRVVRSVLSVVVICAVFAGYSGQAVIAATPRYTVIDLGQMQPDGVEMTDPGCFGRGGYVSDLNDNGVVVGMLPKDERRGNAFIHEGKRMKRLKGGIAGSAAAGVNNSGVVVGVIYKTFSENDCVDDSNPSPVKWVDDQPIELRMPPGALDGYARAVSNDGSIAGSVQIDSRSLPVVWFADDPTVLTFVVSNAAPAPFEDIQVAGGFIDGEAVSFGPNGDVFGWAGTYTDGEGFVDYAVKWSAADGYALEVLGERGAMIITGSGALVAGYRIEADATRSPIVFVDGQVISLPLPEGVTGIIDGTANTVSADGSLIVGRVLSDHGRDGYAWLNGGEPSQATPILLDDLVDGLGDVHLARGTGINAQGQICAGGFDRATGLWHAYLLTPVD